MPVLSPTLPSSSSSTNAKRSSIVHRSESLRSEDSQASKRVSFNRDVHVKRIPRGSFIDPNGKLVTVRENKIHNGGTTNSPVSASTSTSPAASASASASSNNHYIPRERDEESDEDLLREAQIILKQVDSVTCSANNTPVNNNNNNNKSNNRTLSNLIKKGFSNSNKPRSKSPPPDYYSNSNSNSNKKVLTPSKSVDNINLHSHSHHHHNGSSKPKGGVGGKLKKSHSTHVAKSSRAPLNSTGESPTSTSGSGSDNNSPLKKEGLNLNSESPISSISGPEDCIMSMSTATYPGVSSIVQQLNRGYSPSREQNLLSSYRASPIVESGSGNTHNNNKPFSYLRAGTGFGSGNGNGGGSNPPPTNGHRGNSTSPPRNGMPSRQLLSPKEVIYAQVVAGGPGEKRTVHTSVKSVKSQNGFGPTTNKFNNNNNNSSPYPNSGSPLLENGNGNSIHHFVYNDNKENLKNGSPSRYSSSGSDFSRAKPKNNVTTVLINSEDEVDRAFQSDQALFSYRNPHQQQKNPHQRQSSPPPAPSFYFGDNNNNNKDYFNYDYNYNGGGGGGGGKYRPFDYPSSSREASPSDRLNFSSSKLVRDAERKRDGYVSSATLVNSLANTSNNSNSKKTTTYENSNSMDYEFLNHNTQQQQHEQQQNIKRNSEEKKVDTISNGFGSLKKGKGKFPPPPSETQQKSVTKSEKDNKGSLRSISGKEGGGGGFISTLMRRNKEKKQQQQQQQQTTTTTTSNTTVEKSNSKLKSSQSQNQNNVESSSEKEKEKDKDKDKEGKMKRQRAKFLSTFLDKGFNMTKSKTEEVKETSQINNSSSSTLKKKDQKETKGLNATSVNPTTDSEIEEAERRRDGEYLSSEDEKFRRKINTNGVNGNSNRGQITRGKSYNFGDYMKEKRASWYDDQNDSDYRRELANQNYNNNNNNNHSHSKYNSVTLGRPAKYGQRDYDHHDHDPQSYANDNLKYSKSLDRRAMRTKSPPRIVVTPNSPPVFNDRNEGNKWQSSYDIHTANSNSKAKTRHRSPLSKKNSFMSKSSYELDNEPSPPRVIHNPSNSRETSKLRYFGDTDMEDTYNYNRRYNNNNNNNTTDYYNDGNKSMPVRRNGSYLRKETPSKYHSKLTGPSSSLNSSESENGSRMSKASSNGVGGGGGGGNGSQRSVYLHAAAVADIPPHNNSALSSSRRTLSRDELSNHSGPARQTRHLARSMSVLAPWRPRHYREKYEVNYNNEGDHGGGGTLGRPPKPPRSPNYKSMSPSPGRALSSESLLDKRKKKDEVAFAGEIEKGKSGTIGRKSGEKSKSSSLSRSKSMPSNRDSRIAGWWKKISTINRDPNKNKNQFN